MIDKGREVKFCLNKLREEVVFWGFDSCKLRREIFSSFFLFDKYY